MLADTRPVFRSFINWLKSKPADEHYNWFDPDTCACGQFFREKGVPLDGLFTAWAEEHARVFKTEGVSLNHLAAGDLWCDDQESQHTFGALLQRAETEMERLCLA